MRRATTAATMAVLMIAVSAAPAAQGATLANDTAELIEQVAPDDGSIAVGAVTATEVVSTVDSTTTSVPIDPSAAISLEGSSSSEALEVSLPAELELGSGSVADDGTIVYSGDQIRAAVQPLVDGSVRLQTVTQSDAGAHEFAYTFGDGVRPIQSSTGDGIELVRDYGGVAITMGTIDAPWAVDAKGQNVDTHYVVDGDTLTQVISPDARAEYPIVADPKITRTWWNTTVYFNKRETNAIASAAGVVGAAAALVPEPVLSKAIAAAGGLSAAYIGWMINNGSCLKFVYYGHVGNVWQPYGGSEAGGYCR